MHIQKTAIPDVLIIEPKVFGDDRGFFFESFNERRFAELTGVTPDFVQDNHSRSARNVLRGLHYQIRQPQGKLVRVTAGEVFDVAVDMRRSSPTFGRWVGVDPVGREQAAALDAGRLCARLRGHQRVRRIPVQDHRLLGAGTRALGALERPRARHRLAAAGRAACCRQRTRQGVPLAEAETFA